jgi:predicted methyltransferase
MTVRILLLGLAFASALAFPAMAADGKLAAAVASPTRAAENTVRDKYRHPEASLKFWGVKPGQTLIEIAPSNG